MGRGGYRSIADGIRVWGGGGGRGCSSIADGTPGQAGWGGGGVMQVEVPCHQFQCVLTFLSCFNHLISQCVFACLMRVLFYTYKSRGRKGG